MNESEEKNGEIMEAWLQERRERDGREVVSASLEEGVMSRLRIPVEESRLKLPELSVYPKPLVTSFCAGVGLVKFYLIIQLTY